MNFTCTSEKPFARTCEYHTCGGAFAALCTCDCRYTSDAVPIYTIFKLPTQ